MEEIDLETARAKGILPKLTLPKPRRLATKPRKPKTDPWDAFVSDVGALCLSLKVDLPSRELPFALVIGRRWRFDLAWINYRVAVEREGGTWIQGRHTRGKGYAEDCVKYSEAAILGWAVIRLTSDKLAKKRRVETLAQIERALMSRQGKGR